MSNNSREAGGGGNRSRHACARLHRSEPLPTARKNVPSLPPLPREFSTPPPSQPQSSPPPLYFLAAHGGSSLTGLGVPVVSLPVLLEKSQGGRPLRIEQRLHRQLHGRAEHPRWRRRKREGGRGGRGRRDVRALGGGHERGESARAGKNGETRSCAEGCAGVCSDVVEVYCLTLRCPLPSSSE